MVISNHRFKLLINYNNLFLLYTFFKFYVVYNKLPLLMTFSTYVEPEIIKDSFYNQSVFFESKFSIHSKLHLSTKFHRSLWIKSLVDISQILLYISLNQTHVVSGSFLNTGAYFFPIRLVFFPREKNFYKPLFTFFMLVVALQWPVVENQYRYGNSFFYISFFFKMLKFENIKTFRTQQL